jgi:hypothetical protein
MIAQKSLVAALLLVLAFPSIAAGKDKKKDQVGMLESMQSVPCGAKERGVTGLGSMVASLGVEHVNSHEQLCPQYLLRTDGMDYHIRPLDLKHPVVLPIGKEAEFKIKKDRLLLRVADGDKKDKEKPLEYQVVSMQPANTDSKVENSAYHPPENVEQPAYSQSANPGVAKTTGQPPQQPGQPPQQQ